MRTTLYEKLFIDGFAKPSYVVATLFLARPPAEEDLASAVVRTLERHPRLRSLARTRLGVPVSLEPQPAGEWRARGGLHVHARADVRALEERLLGAPLDLRTTMPLEVHVVSEPACVVVKAHHAVIDATSGFAVLSDFARALAGAPPRTPRGRSAPLLRRARHWLRGARLRPRLPGVSVTAAYRPATTLEHEPVVYTERMLPDGHARIARLARRRGATFSEIVASALLSGMSDYSAARSLSPPDEIGLMFARARPRRAQGDASFRADTCVVSAPRARLALPHHPETLEELRRAARDTHHNDLALAALYASRKVLGRPREPSEQRALHLTLSDLTAFGRGLSAAGSSLGLTGMRVLASPTSFDHAGMVISRLGGDLRLSVVSHRGALDGEALLLATLTHLEEA
jgi:hypothetical protein